MNQQEYISDTTMRLELVGSTMVLSPFVANISSQRGGMVGKNLPQVMITDGCETARIQSGFETKFGRYCIDPAGRDHDVQILDIIPKYMGICNENGDLIHSPESTIIYLDTETETPTIGYFTIPDYIFLHSKFGYKTKKLNTNQLVPNSFISKDTKFVEAPNHDDELYKMGVNANVVYMPLWGTTNDAFIISDELQKKLGYTEINQFTVAVGTNYIPLNLYGDETNYKAFPDIGEKVRDDGMIFAMRECNTNSLIADITSDSLRIPSLHDKSYEVPAGAEILDVDIFIHKNRFMELSTIDKKDSGFSGTYAQFVRYQTSLNNYYTAIIDCYSRYKDRYALSPAFSSLVKDCMSWCYNDKYKDLILYCKKDPVDLIYITITYCNKKNVNKGFKVTSRDGAKGVVSDIWKKKDMPSYQNGSTRVYADIVITGESPFNRLNTSQLYEQFINYASDVVVQRCRDGVIPENRQYEYLMHLVGLVRPILEKFYREQTAKDHDEFVRTVKAQGLYYVISPFTNSISPEMIRKISKEYDIKHVPISYYQYDENGNRYKVDVKYPSYIGSKYVMLLGKLPQDALSAIEYGYTSQFNLPVKPTSNDVKQQSLFGRTPGRYGEDETSILTCSSGATTVTRLLGIYSNCPTSQKLLKHHLLKDPYPTKLPRVEMSNKEVIQQSINTKLFTHMWAAAGYQLDIEHTPDLPSVLDPVNSSLIFDADIINRNIPIYDISKNKSEIARIRLTYEDYSKPFFVESMFKQGQDYGTCEFVMADARIVVNTRLALLNIVLWECPLAYGIIPTKKDFKNVKTFTSKVISKIHSKYYLDILKKLHNDGHDLKMINYMEIVDRFARNINRLYNIIVRYMNPYMPPMDALGLAELCNEPKIKKIIDTKIDDSVGTQIAEKMLKVQSKQISELISSEELEHNILLPYMNASTLKSNQIPYEINKYGPRSDVDDRMCKHIINESSFSGIKTVADYAIESLSAKKCAYMNKTVLKNSQYTNRKTRLAGALLPRLYPGWCGSTKTIPFYIEPEFAQNMMLRSIMVDGKIVQLTKDNISQYVGKTVNLLSIFCCNHTDGFCERCAGFRYFPEYDIGLHLFLPADVHVGLMATSQLMSRVAQMILSAKHLIATNTKDYELPVEATEYLSTAGDNCIFWKNDKGSNIPKGLKKWSIRIPADSIGPITDLTLDVLPEPETFSKISYFDIIDSESNQIVNTIYLEADGFIPYLSSEMLEYIRLSYDDVVYHENGWIVPMKNFNVKKAFMGYTVMNDDTVSYVNQVKNFIKTKISDYTSVGKCIHDFAQIVYRKSSLNLFYLEVILRVLNTVSKTDYHIPVIEDPDHTCFMRLDDKVTQASISLKLSQEQVYRYLKDPNAFLGSNYAGLFGPFYGLI